MTQDRKTFLSNTPISLGAGLAASQPLFASSNAQDKVYKVGLIGCGGRGSGAAVNTLLADDKVELTAMADVFPERLQLSHQKLSQHKKVGSRVKVPKEQQFVGFDAYKKLLATDVDIVLLATPPVFRPVQMQAAVQAGKHIFAEKPIAVDNFGIEMAKLAYREAEKKKLMVIAGLHTRYEPTSQAMVQHIHEGAIGDITSLSTFRYQGALKVKHYSRINTDLHRQIGNWLNYTWLGGDSIVELFVHEIDRLYWILGKEPISCVATGGKQQPRSKYAPGHVYDHFTATLQYPNGVQMNIGVRQQMGTDHVWTMNVGGTKGHCQGIRRDIYQFSGQSQKEFRKDHLSGHQFEHDALYQALRAGKYINNGDYLCHSTQVGIMVREAAYSGKEIKWQDFIQKPSMIVDPRSIQADTQLPNWKEAVPGMHGIS